MPPPKDPNSPTSREHPLIEGLRRNGLLSGQIPDWLGSTRLTPPPQDPNPHHVGGGTPQAWTWSNGQFLTPAQELLSGLRMPETPEEQEAVQQASQQREQERQAQIQADADADIAAGTQRRRAQAWTEEQARAAKSHQQALLWAQQQAEDDALADARRLAMGPAALQRLQRGAAGLLGRVPRLPGGQS